ncbi:viral A-type inclusion protein [Reticulomyxa filosa]|uniref:Viral A-type inclusion protein n=1 Tax=Reticulomyxa filosa TaxID=46433 RepID=X6LSI1_RETFI|nr:viral A-type inclusion protein [Reticulomyxa filosa]|eukprot:ETO04331.1 viral A-type inclusion protein [Reticulomyxa filosa]
MLRAFIYVEFFLTKKNSPPPEDMDKVQDTAARLLDFSDGYNFTQAQYALQKKDPLDLGDLSLCYSNKRLSVHWTKFVGQNGVIDLDVGDLLHTIKESIASRSPFRTDVVELVQGIANQFMPGLAGTLPPFETNVCLFILKSINKIIKHCYSEQIKKKKKKESQFGFALVFFKNWNSVELLNKTLHLPSEVFQNLGAKYPFSAFITRCVHDNISIGSIRCGLFISQNLNGSLYRQIKKKIKKCTSIYNICICIFCFIRFLFDNRLHHHAVQIINQLQNDKAAHPHQVKSTKGTKSDDAETYNDNTMDSHEGTNGLQGQNKSNHPTNTNTNTNANTSTHKHSEKTVYVPSVCCTHKHCSQWYTLPAKLIMPAACLGVKKIYRLKMLTLFDSFEIVYNCPQLQLLNIRARNFFFLNGKTSPLGKTHIFTYLKNKTKIDNEEAAKLTSYLRREEKITQGEDIAILESQQWKKVFIHVKLALISKKKLLKTVNQMRESENEKLLNIDEIINSRSSIRELVVFNKYRRQEYTQILCINDNMANIILGVCVKKKYPSFERMNEQQIQLKQQQKKKDKLVRFNLNDERWKHFDLKSGDEIFCEYSLESNPNASDSGLNVNSIEFPVLYQGEVNEDDDSQFVSVPVHCIKQVLLQHNTHTTNQETKAKTVNDSQKKEKWRVGDKVEFRCKYHNDSGLLLILKSCSELLCLAFFSFAQQKKKKDFCSRHVRDIKPTAIVTKKQEKVSHILNWLENPFEGTIKFIYLFFFLKFVCITEKVDQTEYEDMNLSDLIGLYKDQYSCSSYGNKNDDKLKWLKTQITLEAMKYVAKECIIEVRSIPNELIEQVIRNLKYCSEPLSMTDSDNSNISNAIVLLKRFIEKYHNAKEEEDLAKLQKELEQIEVLPILTEQQTSDNMYWIVPKHVTSSRRLRIYLYCPECIKPKTDRARTDKRYPLQLAKEGILWLYWSDFRVTSNSQLLCSIFNQERKIATATISASSQVVVVEEQSLQSKSKRKSAAILSYVMGTLTSNTKNIEVFEHLIREIKDEPSFCFAVAIVKDLKMQLAPSESDISDASADITPNLDQLDADSKTKWDMKQHLSAKRFFVVINTLFKEKPAEQLHLSIQEILMHNLSAFDNDDGIALYDNMEKACSAFDKFMLIPCFNYLALSKVAQQNEFKYFSKMLQNIDFETDEPQTIDEKVLKEVITLDLRLSNNTKSSPCISIGSYLITLLQCYQHTEFIVQLLLDNINERIENQMLTRVLQLIWKVLFSLFKSEGNKKTSEKDSLTNYILQLLLKDKKKRAYWIELLANSSRISDDKLFSKLLRDSLKNWLGGEEDEENVSENVSLHSKVIELMSSDAFAKAKPFHSYLIESVNDKYKELRLNNKKWTSEEINICAKVNWELWPQVIKNINNIPDIEDLHEKNVSDRLRLSLGYCFECQLWFEQENIMQTKLTTFFGKVLTKLVTNHKLLSIHVYKYLVEHRKKIEDISSHCSKDLKSSLQRLDEITNDYTQSSELVHMFRRIQDYLFEHDLSDRLKELGQQSDDWEAQIFVNMKESYKNELQLLKLYQQKMKNILQREESLMFQKMWKHFNLQYKLCQYQKPFSIFDKVFNNVKDTWKDFKQVHITPFFLFW